MDCEAVLGVSFVWLGLVLVFSVVYNSTACFSRVPGGKGLCTPNLETIFISRRWIRELIP